MPYVIVIGGPNGAGKSTIAPGPLRDYLGIAGFVNADDIARGLSAFAPERVAREARRVMLNRLRELAAEPGRTRPIAEGASGESTIVYDGDLWRMLWTAAGI